MPYTTFVLKRTTTMNATAKSVLREALYHPDENTVANTKTMIGQALQSAANHLGYRSESGLMILDVEDLIDLAYEFINADK